MARQNFRLSLNQGFILFLLFYIILFDYLRFQFLLFYCYFYIFFMLFYLFLILIYCILFLLYFIFYLTFFYFILVFILFIYFPHKSIEAASHICRNETHSVNKSICKFPVLWLANRFAYETSVTSNILNLAFQLYFCRIWWCSLWAGHQWVRVEPLSLRRVSGRRGHLHLWLSTRIHGPPVWDQHKRVLEPTLPKRRHLPGQREHVHLYLSERNHR